MPVAFCLRTLDHYGPAKLIAFHAVVLLTLLARWISRGSGAWSFLGDLSPGALLGAMIWIAAAWVGKSFPPHQAILDALAFLVWSGLVAGAARERPAPLLRALRLGSHAGVFVVLAYGGLQLAGYELFPELHHAHEFPVSFFGFQNITAEFLVLALTGVIAHLAAEKNSLRRGGLIGLALVIVLSFPILKSRAAWVALPFALITPFLFAGLARGLKLRLLLAAMVGGLLIIGAGLISQVLAPRDSWDALKSANTGLRLARWKNSLDLIADHPLGTGAGSFPFAYLPYAQRKDSGDWEASETLLIQTPHNSWIGMAAEGGLPFAVAIWILGATLLWRVARSRLESSSPIQEFRTLALSLACVLIVSALFAFPWNGGYGWMLVGLVAGLASACLPRSIPDLRAMGVVTVAGLCWFSFAFARAKIAQTDPSFDPRPFQRACQAFPVEWRTCIRYADRELFARNLDASERALREMLQIEPHQFFALRRLAQIRLERGDQAEACALLQRYDALFQHRSSVREQVRQVCPI